MSGLYQVTWWVIYHKPKRCICEALKGVEFLGQKCPNTLIIIFNNNARKAKFHKIHELAAMRSLFISF